MGKPKKIIMWALIRILVANLKEKTKSNKAKKQTVFINKTRPIDTGPKWKKTCSHALLQFIQIGTDTYSSKQRLSKE